MHNIFNFTVYCPKCGEAKSGNSNLQTERLTFYCLNCDAKYYCDIVGTTTSVRLAD